MKRNLDTFLSILFDPTERTSYGSRFDTEDKPVTTLTTDAEYFCINPLVGSRKDTNVTVFRNLLIESDKLALETQMPRLNGLGLPYSTATYSGGKSTHFIISLEEPCADATEYRHMVKRLYRALGKLDYPVDKSCKNPSRFSRVPGHVRLETNKTQELLVLGQRVKRAAINEWLDQHAPPIPQYVKPDLGKWKRVLSGTTMNFLMMNVERGKRHDAALLAGLDFHRCGYTFEEAWERISTIPDMDQDYIAQRRLRGAVEWAFDQDIDE